MNTASHESLLRELGGVLETETDIQLAIVFGSAAAGRLTRDSDIDIAVLADAPLDSRRRQRLIEELARASGRPIDLIDLRTAGFAITRSALLGGRHILCRNRRVHGALLARTLTDSADFLPYRERILRHRRNAWIR